MSTTMNAAGMSAVKLISDEFWPGTVKTGALQEIKALTPEDKQQLGSAIAKAKGLTQADVNFQMVEY